MHTFLDERDRLEIDNRIKKASSKSIVVGKAGSVVNVTDGANDPLKGLRVFGKTEQKTYTGKNLLKSYAVTQTINGITFTVNDDGSITLNGTSTASVNYLISNKVAFESGLSYTLNGCPSGGNKQYSLNCGQIGSEFGSGITNTMSEDSTGNYAMIYVASGATVSNVTFYPMIRLASIADATYEPYVGGIPSPNPEYPQELNSAGDSGSVEVGVYGKNLLKKATNTKTSNGVTFTPNNDGSVTVNGTAQDGHAFYYLEFGKELEIGQTYTLSGCPLGGGSDKYALQINFFPADHGNGATDIIIDNREYGKPYILVNKGYTANNIIFKPMFRLASIHDDTYEPYKPKQSLTISTPNGLPGIPVTDASLATYTDENGQMWCADEVDFERGVYVQRVAEMGIEYFGDISIPQDSKWYDSSISYSYELKPGTKNIFMDGGSIGVCSHFVSYHFDKFHDKKIETGVMTSQSYMVFNISKSLGICKNVEEFVQWCSDNNVRFIKALKTPIETPLSEEEIAAYKALHTNYPNTTILNDSNAHMEVKYIADIKNHIEQNYVSKEAAESLLSRVSNIEKHMV